MIGSFETLTAADGHSLECWIDTPDGAAKGGLVILQEIFGVTDQLKEVAASYAAQGYLVAVPALFDRQRKGAVIAFDDTETARSLMMGADADGVMADIAATVQRLRGAGKVAVMGFCWGGGLALRCAQELEVEAAVSFYGTRLQQYLGKPPKAALQGHFGKTDTHTPPEVLEAVQAEIPTFEMHLYDAGHAFANSHRPAVYDAGAAETAHARTVDFLAKHLG